MNSKARITAGAVSTKTILLVAAILGGNFPTPRPASIVGYVNYSHPPGYSMIANPLNSTNNTVANLFANPPNYLSVFKRNAAGTGYDRAMNDPDIPGLDNPTLNLAPGEGAFFYNPLSVNYTNTFVGEVVLASTNTIPHGWSIRGSVVPQSGGLQTVLLFPVSPSDPQNTVIYRYNSSTGTYKTYTYDVQTLGGQWTSTASDGPEPAPSVGEAFWIFNPNDTKFWVRIFQ